MTLTLNLTKQEEEQLQAVAARQGLPAEECVLQAVKAILPAGHASEKVAALRTLLEDDEEEQRETGEYLMKALDEDRFLKYGKYKGTVDATLEDLAYIAGGED